MRTQESENQTGIIHDWSRMKLYDQTIFHFGTILAKIATRLKAPLDIPHDPVFQHSVELSGMDSVSGKKKRGSKGMTDSTVNIDGVVGRNDDALDSSICEAVKERKPEADQDLPF